MDLQHIEDRLVEAAEAQRVKGVKIIRGDFAKKDYMTGEVTCMCPITCLTGDPNCTLAEFMAVLGVSGNQLWNIIMGVDGALAVMDDPEYFQLGMRVAKRVWPA